MIYGNLLMDIPEDDKYTSQTQGQAQYIDECICSETCQSLPGQPYGFHVCMILSLIHHGVTQSLKEF